MVETKNVMYRYSGIDEMVKVHIYVYVYSDSINSLTANSKKVREYKQIRRKWRWKKNRIRRMRVR